MFCEILPFCPGQFETDLNRCREYHLREWSSLRISKLHINYLRMAPFRLIRSRIQMPFTLENGYTAWQRDGKRRHIDSHRTSIYCKSLTRIKLLRGLREVTDLILRAALRPVDQE